MKNLEQLAWREVRVMNHSPTATVDTPLQSASASASREEPEALTEKRCSLDPLRDTDRYRLVTPYLLSSRDL
ncbi:MAG: hypothetical protein AAF628_11010 [Planctomycetota bacterium]